MKAQSSNFCAAGGLKPENSGLQVIQACGTSMKPLIMPKDRLLMAPLNGRPPRMGDLLAWQAGSCLMVHRYLGRDLSGRHIAAGDAALAFTIHPPAAATRRVIAVAAAPDGKDWRILKQQPGVGRIMRLVWLKFLPRCWGRWIIHRMDRNMRRQWTMLKNRQSERNAPTSSLIVQETGDELLLYDQDNDQVHLLNPTARFIWERLQQKMRIDEIAHALTARYPGLSTEQARADAAQVAKTLGGLLGQ